MTTPDVTQAIRRSVQEPAGNVNALTAGGDSLILNLASVADSFTPWGRNPRVRDQQLREFWPTEPYLASALYSIVTRNAAFNWTLEGSPETVAATQRMLQTSDFGRGWQSLMTKIGIDYLTQDNGAFLETIRATDSPDAAVVGLSHLDAGKCRRTGDILTPVIYTDRKGRMHNLKWYQVQMLTEFPSPVDSMFGMQMCAVSRILRTAQILRDINIYQREKISGDNPNAIHLVGGVTSQMISDANEQHKTTQAERGMTRFIIPLIVGSLDPTATVSVDTIDLKTIPDGFDFEQFMKWYITQLALGLGADYQDFAPLPGGNLGTSAQSEVLHSKSRGKGPATWMGGIEYVMNFQGVLPSNVLFEYDEQDVEADQEQAELDNTTAETLATLVESTILTPEAARQQLLDAGMISKEVFAAIQAGTDLTPDVVAEQNDPTTTPTSGNTGGVRTAERAEKARRRPRKRRRRRHPPGYQAKADDDLPEVFAEPERLDMEESLEGDMAEVLARAFRRARRVMGLPAESKGIRVPRFGRKQSPEDILGDEQFWDAFEAEAKAVLGPAATTGANAAAAVNAEIGVAVDFALVNAQVLDFSETFTTNWWQQLQGSTERSLRRAITTWQESGLGSQGFPDLVKALEPTFGKDRARLIAVNETTRVFDEGNRLAHNSAGILIEEWQTVEDAHVESICIPLNGQRFPTNEGPRPVVSTHLGCRCARLPVGDTGQVIGG